MNDQLKNFKEFRNKTLAPMLGGRQGGHALSDSICAEIVKRSPICKNDLYGIKGFPRDGKKFDSLCDTIITWFTSSNNF